LWGSHTQPETETTMDMNMIPLYLKQIEANETPSLRIWTIKHGWRRDSEQRGDHGLFADSPYDVTLKHFLQKNTAIGYANSLVVESKTSDWSEDRLRPVESSDLCWRSQSGNQYLAVEPTLVE
jgi:hypothetical protein